MDVIRPGSALFAIAWHKCGHGLWHREATRKEIRRLVTIKGRERLELRTCSDERWSLGQFRKHRKGHFYLQGFNAAP